MDAKRSKDFERKQQTKTIINMKRLILTVAALVMLAVPAVQAQKVNKEAITANLAKHDANIADAKKNTKAATWMARGKAYFEAIDAPTKELTENMPRNIFEQLAGKPNQTGEATINGNAFTTLSYPYFTAYVDGAGNVVGWKQTREVQPGMLDAVLESYSKAYELDPKQKDKIRQGLESAYNFYRKLGNVSIGIGEYKTAAQAFADAYRVQTVPVYDKADAENLFYAGRLATIVGGNGEPEMFVNGAKYLEQALKDGFCDQEGSLYYYLFHCYYGQRETDQANVLKSRDALLEGIKKYPKNELILDGLMNLYTSEDSVGDPKDLIELIDGAIANSPNNVDLLYGRGRVYYAIANKTDNVEQKLVYYDECVNSFKKVIDIKPDDAQAYYLLGIFYMSKAEAALNAVNERHYTVQAEYDRDSDAAVAMYKDALPYLEKAIELNPKDVNSVDLVKQIYFRFRDEGDNMQKYEHYNNLLQELKQ